VIGGPGAFLLRAEDFSSFANAMQNKLQGEVSELLPPGARHVATARPAVAASRVSQRQMQ
jgi:hypothetical protein